MSPGWVVHEKSQNLWNLQSTSGKQERIFFYLPSFKSLWNIRRFVFCSLRFCLFVCLLAFISCGATIFLHYYLHLSSSAWLLQVNYFGLFFFVFCFFNHNLFLGPCRRDWLCVTSQAAIFTAVSFTWEIMPSCA